MRAKAYRKKADTKHEKRKCNLGRIKGRSTRRAAIVINSLAAARRELLREDVAVQGSQRHDNAGCEVQSRMVSVVISQSADECEPKNHSAMLRMGHDRLELLNGG